MKKEAFNIVDFIEKNPLTKLHGNYHGTLIEKVSERLDDESFRIFMTSFYSYLNYDSRKDFVVDLNDVWKWCGFTRKDHAKRLLIKFFNKNVDYVISLHSKGEKGSIISPPKEEKECLLPRTGESKRGRPVEDIYMNVDTFKKFCLTARTNKATQIHNYFITMEEIIMETVAEENEKLANKLRLKDCEIEKNELEMEENILINSDKTPLVYIGIVDDNLVKFGYSKGIQKRVLKQHKKDFNKFILKYTIHSNNYIELEDAIKEACTEPGLLYGRRISKIINDKNQTELIQLSEDFKIEDLYREILKLNEIIKKKKELGKSKCISDLRITIRKQKEEIERLRLLLNENNININFKIRKVNEVDLLANKYFYKFLENFIEDKEEGIHFVSNKDFYDLYFNFIKKEYDLLYVHTKNQFSNLSSRLPFTKYARRNMKKENPEYIIGKDNRIKGKNVIISNNTKAWISEQY